MVRIEYDGGTRGSTPRSITPRRFVQRGGATYLVAFCHLDCFEKVLSSRPHSLRRDRHRAGIPRRFRLIVRPRTARLIALLVEQKFVRSRFMLTAIVLTVLAVLSRVLASTLQMWNFAPAGSGFAFRRLAIAPPVGVGRADRGDGDLRLSP